MPLPRNCPQCRKLIGPLGSVENLVMGRNRVYCSKSCRQKAHYYRSKLADRKPFSYRLSDGLALAEPELPLEDS